MKRGPHSVLSHCTIQSYDSAGHCPFSGVCMQSECLESLVVRIFVCLVCSLPGWACRLSQANDLNLFILVVNLPDAFRYGVSASVVSWFGSLTPQQLSHAFRGRVRLLRQLYFETENADQPHYPTQSQYTDTRPTSPSTDPTIVR